MKDGFIKVAAATPIIKVADTIFNAQSIASLIEKAADCDVKLLVFPELCISGYTAADLFYQHRLQEGVIDALAYIKKATKGKKMLIFVGAPINFEGKLYNTAVAINDGCILGIVPKKHLPNHNEFYEKRHFVPYDGDNSVITMRGEKYPFGNKLIFCDKNITSFSVATEICEDLWVNNPPSSYHTSAGACIIANLSASNELIGKDDFRRKLVRMQSSKCICGYVYADAGEGESTTDMVFSGHNLIAEYGSLLVQSKLFSTGLTLTEIDVNKLYLERSKSSTFAEKRQSDYQYIDFVTNVEKTLLTRTISTHPFVPSDKTELKERAEAILMLQAAGLKKRIEHTKAQCVIVGVSGGLDSCLALIVATRAMELLDRPRKDVLAITMPCFGTTQKTLSQAKMLIDKLGAKAAQIDITKAVKQHFEDIGHDENNYDVTYENAQARERTQVLMDISNQKNGLVIGTGDLSELALGFATYNGDHMSMYAVNNSVPKTLIRHIVKSVADNSCEELKNVLYDILNTPISPELLPSTSGDITQSTEDIIGPYELHDFFLYYFARWSFEPKKILRLAIYAFKDYSEDTILKWLKVFIKRFFASQFKRSCMPDGPKIGSVSLSPRADWRMPSDAVAELWIRNLEE